MPQFVAFLRAINAGAHPPLKMETLRRLFESLGFSGVTTFAATGNVAFETRRRHERALQKDIETCLLAGLGYEVPAFLRTAAEVIEIARLEPFLPAKLPGAELNVIFLRGQLDESAKRKLQALESEMNEFRTHGREVFWLRRKKPDGVNYVSVPLGSALGEAFTVRGARAVRTIAAKLAARG